MKRIGLLLLFILFSLVLASFSFSVVGVDDQGNPNDPTVNPRANACYEGGSLAGKCATTDVDFDGDIEQWEVRFMWDLGWYLMRFEYGIISREQFPSQYEWILPQLGLPPLQPSATPTMRR